MWRVVLIVLTVLLLALIAWWVAPLLTAPKLTTLEQEPVLLELLAAAPADATSVVAVPAFAPAWREFEDVVGPIVGEEARDGLAAVAWIIGNAPLAAWESGEWGAVARPDPLRLLLIRLLGPLSGLDLSVEGRTVRLGARAASPQPFDPSLIQGEKGHLFLLHGPEADYPPMPKPALTAARIESGRLMLTTRARPESPPPIFALSGATVPRDALIALRFAEAPDAVRAIDDAFPLRLQRYFVEGGLAAVYGVDREGIIPVPRIVFAVPADEERMAELRAAIDRATTQRAVRMLVGESPDQTRIVAGVTLTRRRALGATIEFAERDGEFLLALDETSLGQLVADERISLGEGDAVWALHANVRELLPVAETLGHSRALRLVASDFAAEARELAEVLRSAPAARELRAVLRSEGETLRLDVELTLAK